MRTVILGAMAAAAASALAESTGRQAGDRVIAVAPGGFRSPEPHRRSSGTPVKPYRPSGPVQEEGSRATARRRRQIERGQLKAENGLVRGAA